MKNMRDLAPYREPSRGPARGGAAESNPMRRMPAVNPEQTFFHFDFLRALEMHRGLALGIFLAAVVLCGAYLARRWNTYKAESQIYVKPASDPLLSNGQAPQSWPSDANAYEAYMQQQIHNVTRADVLADAVNRIPGFQGANESVAAAADRLAGNLVVARVSTGEEISITAAAANPAQAAQTANAVAQSFIDSATREMRSGDSERIALLGEERDRVMKELGSDRTEQDALNKKLGVAAIGAATPDPYDDQIAAIRGELVKARTDTDEASAKLMATAGGGPSSAALDAAADEIVAADPGLVSMKTALNKRRSELYSQMSNLTPQHPLYKQDAEELSKINSSLETMSKELRAKASEQLEQRLKSDVERTSSVETRLNAQLAQMTSAAGSATPRMQRANDLATDIARLQARYTTVDEQYRNLTINNAAPGAVYLSAAAVAPLHADRKKVYRNAAIVLLVGLIFALAAALIAHNLDPRIYIASDVERVLGFAPMALLPDLYEVGTGVAEEYMLRLAAAVEHAHQQGHLNSCIVTGVAPGAGATTVSARVSSMLQAMGRHTALVDAVGAPPDANINPRSDLVHLPRGSRSTALLQQMTEANDETIVVTDTAPLLISGETEYLARFVDSAIVVIESGATTRAQLREVAQTLERLDVAAVGFVLNRISMAKGNSAFRHSVHAVEKHLKTQQRVFERKRPRNLTPAPDAAPLAEPPAAYQRLWEDVPEPDNTPAPSEACDIAPRTETESAIPRETIFRNHPREEAAEPPVTPETRADRAPERQTESVVSPEKVDSPAWETTRRATNSHDLRNAEADGFLPWETAMPAPIRAQSAANSPRAYAADPAPPLASAAEPVSSAFLKDTPKPVARSSDEPQLFAAPTEPGYSDYLRKFADSLDAAQPPPQAASPALSADAAQSQPPRNEQEALGAKPPAESFKSVPARPARGREGVQVVLGGRPTAPLTGEEVPFAWRERLRAEAEIADPVDVPVAQEIQTAPAVAPVGLGIAARRPDPFEEMREESVRREPLKEWWHDLVAPVEQRSAPAAPIAPVAPVREPAPEPVPALYQNVAYEPAPQVAAPPVAAPQVAAPPIAAAYVAPAPVAPPLTEGDEALYNAATRLSGLRNLLTSLGIQTQHQGSEQGNAEAETQADPRTARVPERAVYAEPVGPDGNGSRPGDSVTARPEIIPPRFVAETAEREKTPKPPKTPIKSPRVNSWESPDDVDILPARRGQYRRHH